jgi:hypothetical protein
MSTLLSDRHGSGDDRQPSNRADSRRVYSNTFLDTDEQASISLAGDP